MSGWRQPARAEPHDNAKLALAIGMALGVLVLLWIVFARSGEESVSSSGFNEGGSGRAPASLAFERRGQTGLEMVHTGLDAAPGAVKPEALSGAGTAASAAPAGPAPAGGLGAGPGATAPAGGAAAPPDPREMAAAGLPTDASGLKRLGAEKGLLTSVVGRLLDHPRLLAAIFNNKLVVDAVMDRDVSRRNCSDSGALASVLSSPNSGPAAKMAPLISNVLSHPDAAAAFATSEMGNRVLACPSVQGLVHNPSALMGVVTANPQVIALISDPRVATALSANSAGSAILGEVQSGLNGASAGGASAP